ncbi:MAG: 3-methyl-2-oxobutanoate dehydrogenase subunit VorB [Desulfovibrionaceae bacterium]|nr:3-methyl-2-oxobutanoate dehydrogenase subunit VorB [Desulfovibrionaceae bacterium]
MSDERILIKGNEAVAYAAVSAGCKCFFGYPITPQNEIPEVLSKILPESGGEFVQAESEVGSANMLLGAGACGVRAMTSTSGPGIDLMQEGISYMIGSQIPAVIVNMSRGGPGLGSIDASQADYFQATRGGSHGAGRTFVFAPSTCQECYDMVQDAFDIAFKYRTPVLVLGDAIIGQLKEPVLRHAPRNKQDDKAEGWRVEGMGDRAPRLLKSVYLEDGALAARNEMLEAKYKAMRADIRVETIDTEDADLVVVAFGSMGRIARSAVQLAREAGHKVGLFRPQTLFPFPSEQLEELAKQGKRFLVIEQNAGQMLDDVRLAIRHYADADFFGVMPGIFVDAEELLTPILERMGGAK